MKTEIVRYHILTFRQVWTILLFIASIILNIALLRKVNVLYLEMKGYKTQLSQAQNQNIMVWQMDSSCFNQIKNSTDGIIRLKINNK